MSDIFTTVEELTGLTGPLQVRHRKLHEHRDRLTAEYHDECQRVDRELTVVVDEAKRLVRDRVTRLVEAGDLIPLLPETPPKVVGKKRKRASGKLPAVMRSPGWHPNLARDLVLTVVGCLQPGVGGRGVGRRTIVREACSLLPAGYRNPTKVVAKHLRHGVEHGVFDRTNEFGIDIYRLTPVGEAKYEQLVATRACTPQS
jgi:hypothetical protein